MYDFNFHFEASYFLPVLLFLPLSGNLIEVSRTIYVEFWILSYGSFPVTLLCYDSDWTVFYSLPISFRGLQLLFFFLLFSLHCFIVACATYDSIHWRVIWLLSSFKISTLLSNGNLPPPFSPNPWRHQSTGNTSLFKRCDISSNQSKPIWRPSVLIMKGPQRISGVWGTIIFHFCQRNRHIETLR